jgi:hypothetical protein
MFGNVGAFVNGNMFCGLFCATSVSGSPIRAIGPSSRRQAAVPSARLNARWPLPRAAGRLAERARQRTARDWVGLAYRQVGALAPKRPKSRKARQKS